MVSEYIAPLNLQYIFQNVFAGSPEIFLGILFIALSILGGLFRMQGGVYLLLVGLAGLMLYSWVGGGFFIMTLVIGSLIIFWSISKIVNR